MDTPEIEKQIDQIANERKNTKRNAKGECAGLNNRGQKQVRNLLDNIWDDIVKEEMATSGNDQ